MKTSIRPFILLLMCLIGFCGCGTAPEDLHGTWSGQLCYEPVISPTGDEGEVRRECGTVTVLFTDSNRFEETMVMPGEDTIRRAGRYWIDGSEFTWEVKGSDEGMATTLTLRDRVEMLGDDAMILRMKSWFPGSSSIMRLERVVNGGGGP